MYQEHIKEVDEAIADVKNDCVDRHRAVELTLADEVCRLRETMRPNDEASEMEHCCSVARKMRLARTSLMQADEILRNERAAVRAEVEMKYAFVMESARRVAQDSNDSSAVLALRTALRELEKNR